VTTLAGGDSAGYVDGMGTDARFELPSAIAVDAQGNVYVSEYMPRIRKIPSGSSPRSRAVHMDGRWSCIQRAVRQDLGPRWTVRQPLYRRPR
jgi:hypothetical protein